MSTVINPYAPPKAPVEDVTRASSEAEEVRLEHIKHEASIRSIGILYYLWGGAFSVSAVTLMFNSLRTATDSFRLAAGVAYLALGVLMLCVARGIRQYKPWARTTTIVLSCIGLLGIPVGTLINGYILYLLLSRKGKRIFATDYPDIVAATPHVKYRTPILLWIALGLLFAMVVGVVMLAMNR